MSTASIFRNQVLRIISRLAVGLVFAFSGFVKLVDPLGSKFKFIDYFNAFDIGFMVPAALPLAILLSMAEFLIGAALLLNFRSKWATWGAFVFMVIFTPLTLYLAITNPVTDCGCFGDALIMTNWETFWKNIGIDVFLVVLIINRNSFAAPYRLKTQWAGVGIIALAAAGFGIYNSTHLPPADFRPYGVGAHIPDKMKIPEGKEEDKYAYDYTVNNKETGEKKTVSSEQYMDMELWKDSAWVITKTSDPYLVKKGYTPPIHDLTMVSNEPREVTGYPQGQDILDVVMEDSTLSFWLVAYNLKEADMEAMRHATDLARFWKGAGNKFYCLTAAGGKTVQKTKQQLQPPYHFFNTDPITLKTIVRSNPGYVLLQHGKILEKWHHNNPPTREGLKEKYLSKEE